MIELTVPCGNIFPHYNDTSNHEYNPSSHFNYDTVSHTDCNAQSYPYTAIQSIKSSNFMPKEQNGRA